MLGQANQLKLIRDHDWQISIGHLGHFLLEFFCQIWTKGILRHMLGPILVIFEICHLLTIAGLFECFSQNGCSQKTFLNERSMITPLSV